MTPTSGDIRPHAIVRPFPVGRLPLALVAAVLLIGAFVGATRAAASSAPPAPDDDDWRSGYTAVRANVDGPGDIAPLVSAIEAVGGRVAVTVPPATFPGEAVVLGWVTPQIGTTLLGRAGIRSVLTPQRAWIESVEAESSGNPGLSFWHRVVTGQVPESPAAEWPRGAGSDVRTAVDEAPSPGGDDHLPQPTGTSDQMTGTVAVGLFMVESNGTLDPDLYTWTPADSTTEVSGVLSALSWWSGRAPTYGKSVSFTLVIYGPSGTIAKSKYEPVLHTSNEVSLWVNDIMSHLGYVSGTDRTRVTSFDNSLISTYGTNWAYAIFCGYNPLPAADSYTNGTSAWAYLNGPYLQTLFRSYGWAVDQVTAHESGHIFGACDEYSGGCGSCDVCTKNVLNANCEVCNPETQACMMKANTFRLCPYTPGQIGWEPAIATVVVDTFTVSDTPPPSDNDGDPEPGETVDLSVTLRNVGNAPARSVTAVMTSASPYVSVVTNSSSYGDVLLTQTGATAYRVSIAASAPVNHVANLLLAITGSGYSGTDTVAMVVSPVRVLRVTPASGVDTGSVTVRIGGHNFLPGVSFRIEKNGYAPITASGVTLVNPDSVSGTLNLVGAQLFSWDLVVQNSNGQTGRLVNGFYVNPAGPTIIAVNPTSSSPSAGTIPFGLRGRNFNIPTSVYIEQGATKRFASGLVAVTADSIACQLNVSGLPTGLYDVVEQNFDTQVARLTGGFQIFPAPDLQAIAPEVVGVGAPVQITLTGASFAAGGTAWLSKSGKTPIYATSLVFDNAAQVRATFDLTSAPVGSRTVVLQNPGGGKDSLVSGLQLVTPPTVTVLHPDGGGHFTPGAMTTVGWTAQSLGNGLDHIQVLLSLDGGLTYGDVIGTAGPDDTSLVWTVPNVNTDSAKVRVVAYDVDNLSGFDDSNAIFGIGTPSGADATVPRAFALGPAIVEAGGSGVATRLDLPRSARVEAEVYDLRGGLVQRVASTDLPAGTHHLRWNGSDRSNRPAASGIYYLRVRAGEWVARQRILLVQ